MSTISLGSWLTFGGSVDERASIEVIHRAYDLGVTFFDTADFYEGGRRRWSSGAPSRRCRATG